MIDLLIIGAGPGGYELALEASKKGLKTILIEADKLGGTCLQRGCIPTKTYHKHAELLRNLRKSSSLGINITSYQFDFEKVLSRKNDIVLELEKGISYLLNKANVEVIKGLAKFISPSEVEVNGAIYQARAIVIATGSRPINIPSIKNTLSSTELLNLSEVPKKLVVIGGGVIGIEMASIFASFGSDVTVVEATSQIIGLADIDLSKRLLALLKSEGIKFHLNALAKSFDDGLVLVETPTGPITIEATHVLMAVGRMPNILDLDLEKAGINYSKKGITTNEFGMTNVKGIYAIGDVTGKMMLAHYATYDGLRVLNAILNENHQIKFDLTPSCVFTFPEVAWCGKTLEEAKKEGLDVLVYKSLFRSNGKALAMNETDGFVKIITSDDKIIGVHIIGPNASTLIHEMSSLMNLGISRTDFLSIIHAHPTLSEIFTSALK